MNFLEKFNERIDKVAFSDKLLTVSLKDGRIISVPLAWYPGLQKATPAARNHWEVCGGGYGIHWPELDEDLSIDGLLKASSSATHRG